MESVVFEDSPVAQYLEGQGEAGDEWASTKTTANPPSPQTTSYAPRGLSSQYRSSRKKPPRLLNLENPPLKGAVARIHHTCSVGLARDFDAAASAGITLIQEVELVSRGYNISNPLPPITRLEETYQIKRCSRLRRTIQRALISMFSPYYEAYEDLKPLAINLDLEKYYDIYEISLTDMEDAELVANVNTSDIEDADTLQDLKVGLQKLHLIRKLFLCTLLALDADGSKSDSQRWSVATETMNRVSSLTSKMVFNIDKVLGDEEEFKTPLSQKMPLTPSRERVRSQMRQVGNLSQGIRGLQAKMRLLREESDKALGQSDEVTESGTNLLAQYDSIGADLRGLIQEWEEGRAALAMNLDKRDHMRSLSSPSNALPASPTLSGTTAVGGGSPQDALQALNGIPKPPRSRSGTTTSSSGEEIFEAVALPRQRSTLTREERIAKMKEDRMRQAIVKEKANANTHMLKELETARLEQANLLKKVVDAIKDLVQDCNFDCNDSGVALQAMDNSHVALVSMMLKAESFSPFRCDRNIALGINLTSLMKVLRCAQNEDILTLKAEDAPDVVNLVFESSESDRISEYDIKLMDIDQEHLGIPETEYAATITMPSAEFQRICRDLMALSESVAIEATKDGVKFSCSGDIGNGAVTLRSHQNVDKPELNVDIALSEPVALTFSLKYLVNFCKASGLSNTVKLCLSNEVPLLVEYTLASNSFLRFYLAPKIGDEE
ncbi:hypothetical protein OEA41_000917 [Lepraria neglecta]|uniref:DNA sliding clamp PCNA n=1 Tax=Lepraria neglecta TaxID=209136 RepID=A0AAE0DQ88_9LECA|nr:hypothetical protein OEA41_000917 [Lepraria neglecta]